MEIKRKPKPKNVLVYMVVFLCMLGAAFFFFFQQSGNLAAVLDAGAAGSR